MTATAPESQVSAYGTWVSVRSEEGTYGQSCSSGMDSVLSSSKALTEPSKPAPYQEPSENGAVQPSPWHSGLLSQ